MWTPAQSFYAVVLVAMVVMRLFELRIAHRNTKALRAAGAIELGAGHYPVMVVLHAAFLFSCAYEVLVLGRRAPLPLMVAAGLVLLLAIAARWWVITTLGPRWTTRVLWVPGTPRIRRGPYRVLAHPNYAAVVVELIALPLLGGAWVTALVFGLANVALLGWRIRVEESAIRRFSAAELS